MAMACLHVVPAGHDVEAAVSPSMPNRREEHVAARTVGRENRDERTLEQPIEVVGAEVVSHAASLVARPTRLGGETASSCHRY